MPTHRVYFVQTELYYIDVEADTLEEATEAVGEGLGTDEWEPGLSIWECATETGMIEAEVSEMSCTLEEGE